MREMPGWERIRVQIDSGAIGTVGPRAIARAFETKETAVSRRDIGFVAARGSGIKDYGEKRVFGHTEDAEGVSLRIHCAGAKTVLGSLRKMNMGGSAVVLDRDELFAERGDEREDADQLRAGPVRHACLGAGERRKSCKEDEGAAAQSLRDVGHGE